MKTKEFKTFWIIWNPTHHTPPTVMFERAEEAHETARNMAARHHQQFYVLRAEHMYETETFIRESRAK